MLPIKPLEFIHLKLEDVHCLISPTPTPKTLATPILLLIPLSSTFFFIIVDILFWRNLQES